MDRRFACEYDRPLWVGTRHTAYRLGIDYHDQPDDGQCTEHAANQTQTLTSLAAELHGRAGQLAG
ncbi:MAG TPA: hypothetical protein VJQ86_03960, partial [Rhodanobacteraceae bacterium]|nr:hypothetical protein [Rhodanobacteraceae bacterium]